MRWPRMDPDQVVMWGCLIVAAIVLPIIISGG